LSWKTIWLHIFCQSFNLIRSTKFRSINFVESYIHTSLFNLRPKNCAIDMTIAASLLRLSSVCSMQNKNKKLATSDQDTDLCLALQAREKRQFSLRAQNTSLNSIRTKRAWFCVLIVHWQPT